MEKIGKKGNNKKTDLLKINSYHQFEMNKIKADYLIVNDASLDKLNSKVDSIINKLIDHLG